MKITKHEKKLYQILSKYVGEINDTETREKIANDVRQYAIDNLSVDDITVTKDIDKGDTSYVVKLFGQSWVVDFKSSIIEVTPSI